MSDIVAWLEMIAANCDADDMPEHADGMRKAVAEIELLREQVHRLKYPSRDCYHIEACPHWVEVIQERNLLRAQVESARASAIEECAALMRSWADEAGDDPRNHILRNVSRNASVAISNLASLTSTGRAKE